MAAITKRPHLVELLNFLLMPCGLFLHHENGIDVSVQVNHLRIAVTVNQTIAAIHLHEEKSSIYMSIFLTDETFYTTIPENQITAQHLYRTLMDILLEQDRQPTKKSQSRFGG